MWRAWRDPSLGLKGGLERQGSEGLHQGCPDASERSRGLGIETPTCGQKRAVAGVAMGDRWNGCDGSRDSGREEREKCMPEGDGSAVVILNHCEELLFYFGRDTCRSSAEVAGDTWNGSADELLATSLMLAKVLFETIFHWINPFV